MISALKPRVASNVSLPNLMVLFVGITMAASPHATRLPLWVSGLAASLLAWRAWSAFNGERLPRKWLLFLFVCAGVFAVHMTHRTLFGREAGVTMLVLFLALKLLETRTERDVIVVTFLCYFLALTNFFYSQSIPTAAFMLLTVLTLTAGLVGFSASRRHWWQNLGTASVLLLQAVPIAAILFFLFPRISGPLWGMPEDAYSSQTGLSTTMEPGSISRLTQSDAIAFRVSFDGEPPPKTELYWRGPVLTEFDGRTWTLGPTQFGTYQFEWRGSPYNYEVTVEPHNHNWLFALEMAARLPPNAEGTRDYQILVRQAVRQRVRYRMSSYTDFRAIAGGTPTELRLATALPEGFNPKTQALATSWRQELKSDRKVLARAIDFFRKQGFEYTLSPPLLGRNTADEFMFNTKRGFCEHFASAFSILMRSAGLPARVVTGYQGGELNPVDDFMVVRQADAHAWSEVWIEGEGWLRVDPTALANPLRVEAGMAAAVPGGSALPFLMRPEFSWLARLRHNWEAATNYWNQWVLGYNSDRQRDFLARLGVSMPTVAGMVQLLFWSVGVALAMVTAAMLWRLRSDDPVQTAWLRFCAKLAKNGCARRPSEGPVVFAERAMQAYPQAAALVRRIADLYVELRYGREQAVAQHQPFKLSPWRLNVERGPRFGVERRTRLGVGRRSRLSVGRRSRLSELRRLIRELKL